MNQRDSFHVSLFDLLQERAELRRQQLALEGTLAAVQRELRAWNDHCATERSAERAPTREVGAHIEELQSRERELAVELCRVRTAVIEVHNSIDRLLQHKPRIAPSAAPQPAPTPLAPTAPPAPRAPSAGPSLGDRRPLPRAI